MIPFAECPACLKRPRARIGGSDLVAHDGSAAGKITDGLTDTGHDTVLIYHCYQCPACGTYYRFESVDIGITRLFRITIAEAEAIFACTVESPARHKHESAAIAKNYDEIIQQMQAGLSHASAVVREYAAETLADEYKKHRNSRALRGLLRHNDPAVLMGVLHSFAERPYQGYSFECPNGFRNKHYATCKPFAEPLRFLREFTELCCNSDARIRRFVFCMLGNSYITDDKMVPALRRYARALLRDADILLGIARARFEIYGAKVYPDATSTLRLGYGKVQGYLKDTRLVPYQTLFYGLFDRALSFGEAAPYQLAPRLAAARVRLDPTTPLNFVYTADTIGGNSGSPVVSRDGALVGLNFDSNLEKLGNRYFYVPDDEGSRAVAVQSVALLHALRTAYDAAPLAAELLGTAPSAATWPAGPATAPAAPAAPATAKSTSTPAPAPARKGP